MGINSLISKLRRRFYWPGYKEDVIRWIGWCDVCQKRKQGGLKKAPLHQVPVGMPMERMAIDIMGPLPVTKSNNKYIVVVADYFTKWTEAFALPNQEAYTVADCLVTNVILRFGAPYHLHSDQGTNFESKLFQEMCKILGINKTRTTAYHPQSDGLVERFNRSLGDMLSKLVNERRDDWDDMLPYVMCAYRATPHRSTDITPNRMMLGREAMLPVDLMYGHALQHKHHCPVEYVEWIREAMEESFEKCRTQMRKAAQKQAKHYNRLAMEQSFHIGDWVLLFYPPLAKQKLALKFLGPYKVTRKMGEVNYEIEAPASGKRRIVHINQLKKYLAEVTPDDMIRIPDIPSDDPYLDPSLYEDGASATPLDEGRDPPLPGELSGDAAQPWSGQPERGGAARTGEHRGRGLQTRDPLDTRRVADSRSNLDTAPFLDLELSSAPFPDLELPSAPSRELDPEAAPFLPGRLRKPPDRLGHNVGYQ